MSCLEPSAERARTLDARMRERLGASLDYIAATLGDRMRIAPGALAEFQSRLAAGPVPSLVFGDYCEVVLAIDTGDLATAEQLFARILDRVPAPAGEPAVLAFRDPRSDPDSARVERLMNSDPDSETIILPLPAADEADARAMISAAFEVIDRGFPEMAAEIRALLREIWLAAGHETKGGTTFDGVSSFFLWGAILLNAREQKTVLNMAQALAHESGHNLLFGLCADGPLVENDDAERFSSPLRVDLRPMDGIVHAVFVIARMHVLLARLLASGQLTGDALQQARLDLETHRKGFAAGMAVVERGARLTDVGRTVMADARRYMAGA